MPRGTKNKWHNSWKEYPTPPNYSYLHKLRGKGKPHPDWADKHIIKRCRACIKRKCCAGDDYKFTVRFGELARQCVCCRGRGQRDSYRTNRSSKLSASKRVADKFRTMDIPRSLNGPTVIGTKWYHLHQSEVHARLMDGEVFLLEACEVPYCYLVPIEKYKYESSV